MQIYVARRGDGVVAAPVNRSLKIAVVVLAVGVVIVGAGLQFRATSVSADASRVSPSAVASAMSSPSAALEAPRTLTLGQRNAIAAFARAHDRHTVFVLSADGTENADLRRFAGRCVRGGWLLGCCIRELPFPTA